LLKLSHEALGQADTFADTFDRLRGNDELYDAAVLKIRNKDGVLVPLDWNFAQRIVSEKLEKQWQEEKRIRAVILKARQEGVSTRVAARFFKRLNLWAGQKVLVIADEIPRAEAIFSIYERFHNNLPEELQPEVLGKVARRSLRYAHDSEIAVRPATDSDAGRAQTIHRLHASEIAFWAESSQREIWVSASSAVPDYNSEIIVESTPKGAGGLFYELWEQATTPGTGWIGIFLPWWIHEEYDAGYGVSEKPLDHEIQAIATNPDPFEEQALGDGIPWEGKNFVLPLSRLVWRRRKIINQFKGDPETLGEDATRDFQQEFPATAEEAFMGSGAMYFDESRVRELATQTKDPILTGKMVEDFITIEGNKARVLRFQKSPRGFVKIWENPTEEPAKPRPGVKYVLEHYTIGCDTAEGKLTVKSESRDGGRRDDRDYSAAAVVTVPPRGGKARLVATIHGWLPADIMAKQVALLGEYFECGGKYDPVQTRRAPAKVAVESNHASGQRVLQYMKDLLKYPNMYWQRTFNTRTNTFEPKIGWRTDERSRDILLDTLGELIRYKLIDIPDAATVKELGQFVYDKTGKPGAIEGAHDDRVIALALAVVMALKEHRHAVTAPTPTPAEIEEQTGG
jgi:hypothetical protein